MTVTRSAVSPLLAVLLLLPVAACSDSTGSGGDGNVRIVLSATEQASLSPSLSTSDGDGEHDGGGHDSFLARVETAEVTIASMLARKTDGVLVDLSMDLPATIDIKALLNGEKFSLPAGTLPAGDYDQIVVVMTKLDLTFINGGGLALTPPGGGWTSIVKVAPFTITDGQDAQIDLEFRMGGALRELNGIVKFFPDFEGHHHDDDDDD